MYCTLYFRNPGTRTCLNRDIPLQATFSSMYFVFGTGFSSGPGLNRYVRRVEGKVLTSQILLQLRLQSQSCPTLASVTFRPLFCQISLLCDRACSLEPGSQTQLTARNLSWVFLSTPVTHDRSSNQQEKWARNGLCYAYALSLERS